MIPHRPGVSDRQITYVLLGGLLATLAVIVVGIVFGGCSQPAAVPTRSLPACTVTPEVISDSFCEGYFAGTSPCVVCFKTAAFFNRDPIVGCVLPNNQYCADGCDDSRCARSHDERRRDAGQ